MGSWNSTCAISNLHIKAGQKVAVFLLVENKFDPDYCYNNTLYSPCIFPFYGENDSYGGVEDTYGVARDAVVEALRNQLYERELGRNEYHDIAVAKDEFDIEKLFEADHENRLGIVHPLSDFGMAESMELVRQRMETTPDENLKKVLQEALDDFEKEKKDNEARPHLEVHHVQIHGDVFDDILAHYYVKDYHHNKTTGAFEHHKIFYADLVKLLPELIARMRDNYKVMKISGIRSVTSDKDEESSGWGFLSLLNQDGISVYPALLTVDEVLQKLFAENADDATIEAWLTEAVKGMWINIFMSRTRKIWQVQCGRGSQSEEHRGYEILNDSMQKILAAEKAERKSWDPDYVDD
jgi:hypothetical protein